MNHGLKKKLKNIISIFFFFLVILCFHTHTYMQKHISNLLFVFVLHFFVFEFKNRDLYLKNKTKLCT